MWVYLNRINSKCIPSNNGVAPSPPRLASLLSYLDFKKPDKKHGKIHKLFIKQFNLQKWLSKPIIGDQLNVL